MKSLMIDEDKPLVPTGASILQRWSYLDILHIFSVEEYKLFSPPFRVAYIQASHYIFEDGGISVPRGYLWMISELTLFPFDSFTYDILR